MNPVTPKELFARLEALGIDTSTVRHPPVFTVEEAKRHRGQLSGTHIKNLFLRDKKKRMWLVVAVEDRQFDLKELALRLGTKHVSFGSPQRLMEFLGVIPGAVTPFAIVNDRESSVRVVIDRAVLDHDPIHCHPLTNEMTTAIRGADLLRLMQECDHEPEIVDFDAALA